METVNALYLIKHNVELELRTTIRYVRQKGKMTKELCDGWLLLGGLKILPVSIVIVLENNSFSEPSGCVSMSVCSLILCH